MVGRPVSTYRRSARSWAACNSAGMIRSASRCPRTSSRAYPKVASAAGLMSTTRPLSSIVKMQSRAASKTDPPISPVSRRSSATSRSRLVDVALGFLIYATINLEVVAT